MNNKTTNDRNSKFSLKDPRDFIAVLAVTTALVSALPTAYFGWKEHARSSKIHNSVSLYVGKREWDSGAHTGSTHNLQVSLFNTGAANIFLPQYLDCTSQESNVEAFKLQTKREDRFLSIDGSTLNETWFELKKSDMATPPDNFTCLMVVENQNQEKATLEFSNTGPVVRK